VPLIDRVRHPCDVQIQAGSKLILAEIEARVEVKAEQVHFVAG